MMIIDDCDDDVQYQQDEHGDHAHGDDHCDYGGDVSEFGASFGDVS